MFILLFCQLQADKQGCVVDLYRLPKPVRVRREESAPMAVVLRRCKRVFIGSNLSRESLRVGGRKGILPLQSSIAAVLGACAPPPPHAPRAPLCLPTRNSRSSVDLSSICIFFHFMKFQPTPLEPPTSGLRAQPRDVLFIDCIILDHLFFAAAVLLAPAHVCVIIIGRGFFA